jgi:hypothetical protein
VRREPQELSQGEPWRQAQEVLERQGPEVRQERGPKERYWEQRGHREDEAVREGPQRKEPSGAEEPEPLAEALGRQEQQEPERCRASCRKWSSVLKLKALGCGPERWRHGLQVAAAEH